MNKFQRVCILSAAVGAVALGGVATANAMTAPTSDAPAVTPTLPSFPGMRYAERFTGTGWSADEALEQARANMYAHHDPCEWRSDKVSQVEVWGGYTATIHAECEVH